MLGLDSDELKLYSWIQKLRMDSWTGYRLDLIVDPIWIRMLRLNTNVWIGFKWAKVIFTETNVDGIQVGFDYWTNLDTNVKNGYEC